MVCLLNPPRDSIEAETNFWFVTADNEVVFPRWDNIGFSEFWWGYFLWDGKRVLIDVGRGGGKGYNVLFKAVYRAITKYFSVKDSGIRYTGPQWHLMVVAPSAENYADTMSKLLEMVPQVPGFAPDGNKNYRVRTSAQKCDFRLFGENELLITVLSSYEADYLRGKSADEMVIDEGFRIRGGDVADVLIQVVQRQGRPPIGGYLTIASTPDTEDLKDPWFDAACDQADPTKPDRSGFFDNFKLFEADFTVNPFMSDELFEQILRERLFNLNKFLRERMAVRGLVVDKSNLDGTVGNIITLGMLEPCFYTTQVNPKNVLIAIDLAFGTKDCLVRMFFDKTTNSIFGLDIYNAKDQQLMGISTTNNAFVSGLTEFFQATQKMWPGATILYDATGQLAGVVQKVMPGYLRTKPVVKTNRRKNELVEAFLERLAMVENGVNHMLRLPSLEATWLTQLQRDNFKEFYKQMVNIRKEIVADSYGNVKKYRYTKVAPHKDDCFDTAVLFMDELDNVRGGQGSLSGAFRASGR